MKINHSHEHHHIDEHHNHHNHYNHSSHDHHHHHHGDFKKVFFLSLPFGLLVMWLSPLMGVNIPFPFHYTFKYSDILALLLSLGLLIYGGKPFIYSLFAIDSADVILTNSEPGDIESFIELSVRTNKKMNENLLWGAGYNFFAIPLAAGVLSSIGIVITPALGAILMSLSTIIVSLNAMTLNMKRGNKNE